MKRIKFLFITFLIFVVCFCCSGCISCRRCFISCNPDLQKEYLIEEISKFEVEVEGYKLITNHEWEQVSNKENITYGPVKMSWTEEYWEVSVQGKNVKIKDLGQFLKKLFYDNKEVEITEDFLRTKNKIYKESHSIWEKWNSSFVEHNEIHIAVFDNKLFIVTFGLIGSFVKSYVNEYPAMLYWYNLETDQILYAGSYLDDLNIMSGFAVIKSED